MSFCNNCGAPLERGVTSCRICGKVVDVNNAQTDSQDIQFENQQQQEYPTQIYSPQQGEYPYVNPAMFQQELPMKWFKFIVSFVLGFSAFMNFVSVMVFFLGFGNGTTYGRNHRVLLLVYEGLPVLETVMCIWSVLLAFFCIFVRFRLASFKADGPKMLMILYICSAVMNIIYIIGIYIVTKGAVSLGATVHTQTVVCTLMVVCNKIYFDKRKHLFVN